jgi:hypothetical protein
MYNVYGKPLYKENYIFTYISIVQNYDLQIYTIRKLLSMEVSIFTQQSFRFCAIFSPLDLRATRARA